MHMDARSCLTALNAMSADLYEDEVRLSTLLRSHGLDELQIIYLSNGGLMPLLSDIHDGLRAAFVGIRNGERLCDVLFCRYGLFGCERMTLRAIGDEHGVSHERIRQLQRKALRRLSGKRYEQLVLSAACRVLHIEQRTVEAPRPISPKLKPKTHKPRPPKENGRRFALTVHMRDAYEISQEPQRIQACLEQFNCHRPPHMRPLRYMHVMRILEEYGYVYRLQQTRYTFLPTEKGESNGITLFDDVTPTGACTKSLLFSPDAQRMLLSAVDARFGI